MSRRERLREHIREEIKTVARQQMAESGTASLSLAGIARAMELTTPALYRYYADRDALITALVLDAFGALAETLQATAAQHSNASNANRLLHVLLRYRTWALEHPVDFQLIYGNPIPGYVAPAEQTAPAARQTGATIAALLQAALVAGELHLLPEHRALPPTIQLSHQSFGLNAAVDPTVLYITAAGWARLHGIITLELFHHLQPVVGDVAAFYRHELLTFMDRLGLTPSDTS